MSDAPTVNRHEIMEERGNRDAFHLCVLILVVVFTGLVVLGIAAWKMNVIMMPLMPRDPVKAQKTFEFSTPRAESAPSTKTASSSEFVRGVENLSPGTAEQTCRPVPVIFRARHGLVAKAMERQTSAEAAGLQDNFPNPRATLGSTRESHVSRACDRQRSDTGAARSLVLPNFSAAAANV